jgi:hypothetical protein
MPIPKYDGSNEKEWIGKCMGEIPLDEYTQEQALAICYKQMEMSETKLAATAGKTKHQNELPHEHDVHHGATSDKAAKAVKPKGIASDEELAKIPIEIIGDNEEKILDYLPEPKPNEMEHDYLGRCVIVLYPEYYDQQQATSLCADKYQRKVTVTNLSKQNLKTMKPIENKFELNRIKFLASVVMADIRKNGIRLAEEGGGSYPWDECIADQTAKYGADSAEKICGYIKSTYGS